MPKAKKPELIANANPATKKKLAQLAGLLAAADAHPGEFLEARHQARMKANGQAESSDTPRRQMRSFEQLVARKTSAARKG